MDPEISVIIATLISSTFEKVILPLLGNSRKPAIKELELSWNEAFTEYLIHSYNKYSKIKTLLFTTEPKFIYDFFEPPLLSINNRRITTQSVTTIFQESHFLIIKGEGGMGKSTLLKHFFINTIEETEKIPIFLELLGFNDSSRSIDIFDLLKQKLSKLGCSLEDDLLELALISGCFVFFLDGYDELNPDRRDGFLKELDGFCDKYSSNYYVMTSRPLSEFIEFQRFTVLTCERFSKKQAVSLITKINPYDERIKEQFITDLKRNLYRSHEHFASNPLLLTIMFITYDNYAEVPAKRHIFYDCAYETMYHRHDATKGAFKRVFRSEVPSDRFKKILAYFSFIAYRNGKVEMAESEVLSFLSETKARYGEFDERSFMDDLLNAVCILYKDGLVYKFIHRSFQEYFVAFFLTELPDEKLSNIARKMILSDHNFSSDDVFIMLSDMAKDRFINSVLMPYLRHIEEGINSTSPRFDQYYEILFRVAQIRFQPGDNKPALIMIIKDSFLFRILMQDFIPRNFLRNPPDIKSFLNNLGEIDDGNGDTKITLSYNVEEMKANGLYEIIKASWVGADVDRASNLLAELEKQQRELDSVEWDL